MSSSLGTLHLHYIASCSMTLTFHFLLCFLNTVRYLSKFLFGLSPGHLITPVASIIRSCHIHNLPLQSASLKPLMPLYRLRMKSDSSSRPTRTCMSWLLLPSMSPVLASCPLASTWRQTSWHWSLYHTTLIQHSHTCNLLKGMSFPSYLCLPGKKRIKTTKIQTNDTWEGVSISSFLIICYFYCCYYFIFCYYLKLTCSLTWFSHLHVSPSSIN